MALSMTVASARCGVAQAPRAADSVTIRIVGTELRSAVQIMQQYLDRPVIFVGRRPGPQVTLETPRPVPRADVPRYLRGLLDVAGLRARRGHRVGDVPRAAQRSAARPRTSAALGAAGAGVARRHAPHGAAPSCSSSRSSTRARPTSPRRSTRCSAADRADRPNVRDSSQRAHARRRAARQQIRPLDAAAAASDRRRPPGRSATLTGELTIVPDSRANSLLIRANRADFELIQAAVEQIDVRPPQVLIEVLIVEARRDRSFSLGVDARSTTSTSATRRTRRSAVRSPRDPGPRRLHAQGHGRGRHRPRRDDLARPRGGAT